MNKARAFPGPEFVRKARCKEWRAFQLGNERWLILAALYEAKLVNMGMVYVWDKVNRKMYSYTHSQLISNFGIARKMDGDAIGFSTRASKLHIVTDLSGSNITLCGATRKTYGRPAFSFCFSLNPADKHVRPMSVVLPFSSERGMYSMKSLMPVHGWMEIGSDRFDFNEAETLGVFDDHKGYYPYRMRYNWVTGFGFDGKGRRVAFNLTENQVIQQRQYNENVLWVNNKLHTLPPIKITRPEGVKKPWHIQDVEGLVDLVFIPDRSNRIRINALVAEIDYHGPFGSFTGTLKTNDGEKLDPAGLYGMGEQKYLRV